MFKLTEQRKSMIPVAVKTAKIGVPECPCLSWVCAVIPFIVARYDEHGGCGVSEHGGHFNVDSFVTGSGAVFDVAHMYNKLCVGW